MTDPQAVARELYRRVTAPCHYPSEPMDEKEARIELILDALDARERAVWAHAISLASDTAMLDRVGGSTGNAFGTQERIVNHLKVASEAKEADGNGA